MLELVEPSFASSTPPDVDFLDTFYARIYTGIGTMTGIAAWYFARLVASVAFRRYLLHLRPRLPYAFIMSLALELNLFVAAVATIAFGFILLLTWLAHLWRRNETATAPQSTPVPADGQELTAEANFSPSGPKYLLKSAAGSLIDMTKRHCTRRAPAL